jgi:lipopolysaccharide export system ATP-binding protein
MALEKQLLLYDCRIGQPNSGNIYLDDLNITDYPMYKGPTGNRIFGTRSFCFRKLSIEDNILSVLQLTNLSKEEQVAKMESLIAEFSLEHIRTNRGDLLSGGERVVLKLHDA